MAERIGHITETPHIGRTNRRNSENQQIGRTNRRNGPNSAAELGAGLHRDAPKESPPWVAQTISLVAPKASRGHLHTNLARPPSAPGLRSHTPGTPASLSPVASSAQPVQCQPHLRQPPQQLAAQLKAAPQEAQPKAAPKAPPKAPPQAASPEEAAEEPKVPKSALGAEEGQPPKKPKVALPQRIADTIDATGWVHCANPLRVLGLPPRVGQMRKEEMVQASMNPRDRKVAVFTFVELSEPPRESRGRALVKQATIELKEFKLPIYIRPSLMVQGRYKNSSAWGVGDIRPAQLPPRDVLGHSGEEVGGPALHRHYGLRIEEYHGTVLPRGRQTMRGL